MGKKRVVSQALNAHFLRIICWISARFLLEYCKKSGTTSMPDLYGDRSSVGEQSICNRPVEGPIPSGHPEAVSPASVTS